MVQVVPWWRQLWRSPRWRTVGLYLLLGGIAIAMLLPLFWLLTTALKSPEENIFEFPPRFLPQQPTLANFWRVLEVDPYFGRYFINSLVVAVLTVILNLGVCSLAAYPLARLRFWGRELIFSAIVATIMIPFQIVMIPLYILTVQLGLRDSYLGLVFPYIASAFGIFLMRQAFQGVPKELEEAARLDGCSELGIWWHIMLPATRPALVTLAIFSFIGSWSDFLWPLIVVSQPEYTTLPLGVAKLSGMFSLDWRVVAAASVLSVLPVVLLFVALQRFIVPTAAGSGLKG